MPSSTHRLAMQRPSDAIGAIAVALARAQIELANPEKSLTATVVSPFPRDESRTFHHAPLSADLEIVRKCLGRHKTAAITSAQRRLGGLEVDRCIPLNALRPNVELQRAGASST